MIDGIGPVTGGITALQDRKNTKLWLYFGTGRFFYPSDDASSTRHIMGVQDRCYTSLNVYDKNCSTTAAQSVAPAATGQGRPLALGDLTDQSTSITASTPKGWYRSLRPEDTANSNGAERVVGQASPKANGTVFFTTLQPTSDVCKYGGSSYQWAANYSSGDLPTCSTLGGVALLQMTTGAFEQVKYSDLFSCKDSTGAIIRPTRSTSIPATSFNAIPAASITSSSGGGYDGSGGGSSSGSASGGGDGSTSFQRPVPLKKMIHVKEK